MENNTDISDTDDACVEDMCQVARTVRMLDLAATVFPTPYRMEMSP